MPTHDRANDPEQWMNPHRYAEKAKPEVELGLGD
jgi:hypothetical protein